VTVSSGGSGSVAIGESVLLSDSESWAEYIALFEKCSIKAMKVGFYPYFKPGTQADYCLTAIHAYYNPGNVLSKNAPTSISEVLEDEREQPSFISNGNNISIKLPVARITDPWQTEDEAADKNSEITINGWISTALVSKAIGLIVAEWDVEFSNQ
jgi:hypothetical protein